MAKERGTKACRVCGLQFARNKKFSSKQWAMTLYCSRTCAGVAKSTDLAASRPALIDKFRSKFSTDAPGCWEWQGTIEGYGYGVVDHAGKRYRAHVLALELDGRPVPAGMVARHKCDNRRCVRPDHLEVGTPHDNALDAMERGRLVHGNDHPHSKLTVESVRAARRMRAERPDLSFAEIARSLGVARITMARAIKGDTWRHVQ